jgi:large subunit ribosomal protein L25
MERIVLKADLRKGLGKEANNRLRKQGKVPAVVYKKAHETMHLEVNARDLFSILHTAAGENVIITLDIAAGTQKGRETEKTVIIKEIQYHPINTEILHLDFHEISLTEKITVDVPVETKGEPVGVKSDGGILDHPVKELSVECLPTQIPEKIYVHVENLKIGDAIRIKDLEIPADIKVLNDPEQTVVSVVPPQAEEEAAEEEVLTEEAAEPEVIREKKPDEGDTETEEQK